jgi:tryptophan synthase alpha chain
MNRIDQLFQHKTGKSLAVYFTAGFPNLHDTGALLSALQDGGVDLIEIGMPFSDPLADGEVIQQSSAVALRNGMTIDLLFEQLKSVREVVQTPLVLMGYLNPVLQYGMLRFLESCKACGIDGVILPDMPADIYDVEYKSMFDATGIYPIFLVTPRTPKARAREIAARSRGFLYVVSSATTTGATGQFSPEQRAALESVAALDLDIPLMTGFGIHNAATLHDATVHTRGAIVGSAFIKILQQQPNPAAAVAVLRQQLQR